MKTYDEMIHEEVTRITAQHGLVIEQFERLVSQCYPQFRWDSWITECSCIPCIGICPENSELPCEMFPLEHLFGQDGALTPEMRIRLEAAVDALFAKGKWLFIENSDIYDLLMPGGDLDVGDQVDYLREEQILIQRPDIRFKALDVDWQWGFKSQFHLSKTLLDIGYLIGMEHARHDRTDTRLGRLSPPKILGSPEKMAVATN
jgi:hypothetical protein